MNTVLPARKVFLFIDPWSVTVNFLICVLNLNAKKHPRLLSESNSHLPFPVQPKKNMVFLGPYAGVDYKSITSRYIHSRVDSNKLTMRIGQPFARADLNPMAESTFSPSQGLWFWPQHNPNCRPPPHATPPNGTIPRATSGSASSASVIKKRRTSRDEDRRRVQEGIFAISL